MRRAANMNKSILRHDPKTGFAHEKFIFDAGGYAWAWMSSSYCSKLRSRGRGG